MNTLGNTILAAFLGAGLAITGCGESGGHDHDHDHADHDHDHGNHAHGDETEGHADHDDADAHGEMRPLGQVTLAGATLNIAVDGDVSAGSELHVDVTYTDGEPLSAVRVWVGVESAEGSMKARADAADEGYHAHVEVPDPMPEDSRLWIEAEDASGEREHASLVLGEG